MTNDEILSYRKDVSEESEKKHVGNLYPHFFIKPNKSPNRFYAIPLVGFFVKMLILIPVFFEVVLLFLVFIVLWTVNSFVILFTGRYWETAYTFFLGFMHYGAKISAYIYGLTDHYPGFTLSDERLFELTIPKPAHPNRWLAIPLIGLIIRSILIIPYHIFMQILGNGSWVAMIIAWFPILTKGVFPESAYEFEQDTIRVSMAYLCYLTGLSDRYPSFQLSMKHQTIKILLLIAGALLFASNIRGYFIHPRYRSSISYPSQYNTNPLKSPSSY